ncbi:ATP-dependent sacrificial sulfur transferase LarE [bacterium]|nr:ATP-dependent sacrificial sulfur transferase LarE [bacterium]
MTLEEKKRKLLELLKTYQNVAIAFSGGVDSSFLLKMAKETLGDNCVALTIDMDFVARSEMSDAEAIVKEIGAQHTIIKSAEIDKAILENSKERCYFCKRNVFEALLEAAKALGINILLDGSNLDDLDDYRPGMKALKELEIKSPLIEAGFTKNDIRAVSEELGLSTWNKPSLACLASRFPYNQHITMDGLKKVEAAEEFLRQKGIRQVRVRYHQDLARIEVSPEERSTFFDTDLMDQVSTALLKIGFKYVTLDMEGYRTGKMNQ